jgi:hypothetical protein
MTQQIHPIYDRFFPLNERAPEHWEEFEDYHPIIHSQKEVDFSISSPTTWLESAQKVALLLTKIILFPWGLYEGLKYLLTRIVMLVVNPAQYKNTSHVRKSFYRACKQAENERFIEREILLEKDGIQYRGVMLGTKDTIANGKWCSYAIGNAAYAEETVLANEGEPFLQQGYNLLVMNGPAVGGSQGAATPETLGDVQDLAMTFLESAVKAKKIALAGYSLGGASLGKGILKHRFQPNVQYWAVRMMTFDRLSHLAEKTAGSWAKKLIFWLDLEMDSVEASKKLQELGVPEMIIEGGEDEIMEGVRLCDALAREQLLENKFPFMINNAAHYNIHRTKELIKEQLQIWDEQPVENAAQIAG